MTARAMAVGDDGWRDLPLAGIQRLLASSFAQISTYEELTNAERECVTADEFAVLYAWTKAAPVPNYGECATCGTVNAAQVRL